MVLEESTTYQAIIRKARLAEARQILLDLGQQRFGPGEEKTLKTLNAIEDVQRLEELIKRLLKVSNWQELLLSLDR